MGDESNSPLLDEFISADYSNVDLEGEVKNNWDAPTENDSLTDTLDEPVHATLMRDVGAMMTKFRHVFMPTKSSASRSLLQDWDLWGPLLVCCVLGLLLNDEKSSSVFTFVFTIIGAGSLMVTFNTKLLGGNLSALQSICVLGYCLGPLTLAFTIIWFNQHIITILPNILVKCVSVVVGLGWSCYASLQFMMGSISEERKMLAVYPICLFYTVVAWMILTQ
jgi:hypothetical protein